MPASAKLEIGLIGPFSLRLGTEEVRIQGRKARALLAYLALAEGLHATRDSLLGLLWSGSTESAARASLRQCLHEVQRAFQTCGFEGLQADRSILRLSGELVSVDVLDIVQAARNGSVHPKLPLTHRLTDSLMADLETLDGEFRDWITQTRQSIQGNLIEHLMAGTRSDARHQNRIELSRAVLTLDPAHEGAARLLMRELAAAGNAAGALRVYKTLWDTLETEFDTEPAAETQELVAAIKLGEPVAVVALDNPPTVLVTQSSISPGSSLESLIENIARSHGGSVVSRDQNRFVLDFSDPRAAVQSALAMHEADRSEATASPRLAMGAHAGHPLDDGGADIRTVASRLASTGRPGDVLVSSSVRDVLTDGLDATIQHAGADVYRIAETPAGHSRANLRDSALLPSIAIMSIEPAAPGANDDVMGEIIADELIASLCAHKELSVISRLSTRAFRGRAFTPSDLGRRLGAHYVLSGSYRTYSGQLELNLEFTDARTNTILWILGYREAIERVLDGSGDIVPQVAASIGASTLSREVERVRTRPLELLENYSLLMAAINLSHRASTNSFSQARGLLELLVQRLPAHPLPLAWLAKWHVFKINQGLSADWAQDARQAIEWAQLATELDPTCSIALTVNAWAHLNLNKRFDVADQLFDRAVEANPSDSTAWLLKGAMHAFRGEGPVAVDAARRAIHLSPLDPRRSYYDSHAATAYLSAGDYTRSIESAQRSLRLDSAHVSPLRALAIAQTLSGRIEDARKTVALLLRLDPTLTVGRYLSAHPAAAFKTGQLWAEALGIAGLPK